MINFLIHLSTEKFNIIWYDSSTYGDSSDDPNVEIVRCTARSGDILTVSRAQESTSASNKDTPGSIYKMMLTPTKKTITDIKTEYESGINSAISTHSSTTTGIHGVGVSTVESVSGSVSKVSTHAAITSSVHGFDVSGNAPAQSHGSTRHTGTIGDHTTNISNVGTNTHTQIDTAITNSTSHIANSGIHLPSQTGNTGKYLKTDGSAASWQTGTGAFLAPEQVPKIASTNIRHSNDAEVGVPYETFGLLKIIRFTNGITGTVRLYSDVLTAHTDAPTWIEFRVNGTVIGSYTYGTRYPYTTIAVDATRTILPGEAIEMWGKTSGELYGMYSLIKNYRIAYDNDPNIVVAVTYS